MPTCPECGQENPDGFTFCPVCATPLTPLAPERRKLATVLFCDVAGSTAMGERLDAESVRAMMFRYFHTMREAIEHHGGTVEKFVGDAVMAVFGVPASHEDDALRAVRAASEMQARLADLNPELERQFGSTITLRIGLNTGEVVAGDATTRQTLVTGDTVNIAARLEQAASAGDVFLGETTYRLCSDAVTVERVDPLRLKGKSEPVPAYRLLAINAKTPGRAGRLEGNPIVGRECELRLLKHAFAEVVSTRSSRLFTIVGEPGVGKSRLAAELLFGIGGEATILRGRCLSYGEGITFWPIGEIVREAAGIRDEDSSEDARARITALLAREEEAKVIATRVAQVIGLEGGHAAADEIFWSIRKLFEALARHRPLLLLFDDIHWAEPALLDLVASLPASSNDAAILLLCLARPELHERRPEWETQIRLEPLAEGASGLLLENLLHKTSVAPDLRRRITRAGAGNPLFLEELVAMLVEDGLLTGENGSRLGTAELAEVTIPPTLSALLGARLDRLGEERPALERGAIEGEIFHRGAVAALSSPEVRPRLSSDLSRLANTQLIRRAPASFVGEAAFRFRHILIRDAAYQATPKTLRAELHERFADWLELVSGRAGEYEEILGYHLEQAYRYHEELGPIDENARQLAARAAERLCRAGRRAFARTDMPAAANLLQRAADLLPEEALARREILPLLGHALMEAGELQRAEVVLVGAIQAAAGASDRHTELHARIDLMWWRVSADPELTADEIVEFGEAAIPAFTELGDEQGLARVWRLLSEPHFMACRFASMVDALEQALLHARRAGDQYEEAEVLRALGPALRAGPTPVAQAYSRYEQVLRESRGRLSSEARVLDVLALLDSMRGAFDLAERRHRRANEIYEGLGLTLMVAASGQIGGRIKMHAGDLEAAESEFRSAHEALERLGEKSWLSSGAAELAEVLYSQGRYEEAESFALVSKRSAQAGDIDPQARWRATYAKVLAKLGELDRAEELAREAVQLCEGTDFLDLRGDVAVALAEVLHSGGKDEAAILAAREALGFYEQKGNVVSAGKASLVLAELQAKPTKASGNN